MAEILFLVHRAPWPPDRGDRIRSWHMFEALAKLAPVHVAALADTAEEHHGDRLAGLRLRRSWPHPNCVGDGDDPRRRRDLADPVRPHLAERDERAGPAQGRADHRPERPG